MENPIATFGLDEQDLADSVNEMLQNELRKEAALSLRGDAACQFLDILQKVRIAFPSVCLP